jgi:GT2 family glycosyltransferase
VAGVYGDIKKFLHSVYDTADHVSVEVFVVAEDGQLAESFLADGFPDVEICPWVGSVSGSFKGVVGRSTARYVSFWDDRSVVLNGCLMSLVGFLDDEGEVGIVGPKVRDDAGVIQQVARTFPNVFTLFGTSLPGGIVPGWHEYASAEVDWYAGSGVVVSRMLLDDIGSVSGRLCLWQLDLCCRAKRAGWHIRTIHDAQIIASLGAWQKKMAGGDSFFLRRWFEIMLIRLLMYR